MWKIKDVGLKNFKYKKKVFHCKGACPFEPSHDRYGGISAQTTLGAGGSPK